ncbi:ATP-binding protein [Bradyrhizobium sp.]|uniref:ATP-dependent nuclease n=1 Tax=Bradyrhizobium sp. TaxID=376 RepID=UPI002DDD3018|nr:ATP-binding protein [Bradyrhizobium sp.]HEV2160443.1 ATP-binding protein [Bradyrhizobium sp.]
MRIRHLEVRNFRGIKSLKWRIVGDLNCIIGSGDACKTTILTALDYALSPRTALAFDDADFFNQAVDDDIVIQVTLGDWDETQPHIRAFFQESTFARYQCGLGADGPEVEPNGMTAFSVSLRVDKSLEPKWFAVKGRDTGDETERKPIYAAERALIGLSRLDLFSDAQFTWGRNTILTRLSEGTKGSLTGVVSELAREMRQSDISGQQSIAQCKSVADTVRVEARNAGVNLGELAPKIDVQRHSIGVGVISLHEGQVPLRNKGSGSKRLVGAAMQMKLHNGKNIAVIDEIELGLEPYRIRGLLHKLKASQQQVFATTHSAAVIRELDVTKQELWVCRRDSTGAVIVKSLNTVSGIQGPVRTNAEAFLGNRIVACEGLTEIGLLRAYDVYRFDANSAPVWSLATAYFNSNGASNIKPDAESLAALGYRTAVLCDNDAPEHLSDDDIISLQARGIHVAHWQTGNATEHQLFAEMPWTSMPTLLTKIAENHDEMQLDSMIDAIVKEPRVKPLKLASDPATWPEDSVIRKVLGDLAHKGKWIKRIDYARKAFEFALPLLPDNGILKARLSLLWDWVQQNE